MVWPSSRSVLQEFDENGRDIYQAVRISRLPDDVLTMILSLLTSKEAITTSILSRRWTSITTNLNFAGKPLVYRVFRQEASGDKETFVRDREIYKAKFVDGVNHVLKLHQGTTEVDQFRVCFDMDASNSSVLDSWINFAIEKRVQKLELNLASFNGFHDNLYSFPSVKKLKLMPLSVTRLVSPRLMFVDVTAELVRYFLAQCPFLEELCVAKSDTLSNLKIDGQESRKLKYLNLYGCSRMRNLEISAPNLVSFTYSFTCGRRVVPLKNVPVLS